MDQPNTGLTQQSLYATLGGDEGIRKLVNTFYDLVETTDEGKSVALLHLRGHGIKHAREEQFNFLSGFLGGPKLFAEKWGHSNVREIHAHVEINEAASQAWLACMEQTLIQLSIDAKTQATLMDNFTTIADLLVRQSSH